MEFIKWKVTEVKGIKEVKRCMLFLLSSNDGKKVLSFNLFNFLNFYNSYIQ